MVKRGIRIVVVIILAIALMTLAGRGGMSRGDVQEENTGSKMQSIAEETEEAEQESVFEQDQALYTNLLGSEFLNSAEEEAMISQAQVYAEEVKERFVPEFCEKSGFPEDLVVKLEEILYHSGSDGIFDALLSDESEELGAQDFRVLDVDELERLFPKAAPLMGQYADDNYLKISECYDIPENTHLIERIQLLPGKDIYVINYFDIGIRKNRIRLTERIGDEFVTLYEFEFPETSSAFGVMQYENEFYYVAHDNDREVREDDKIIIYRLEYDSLGDGMSIQYKQTQYIWKECPFDTDGTEIQPFLEDGYMDKVMQDFSTGKYLYEGGRADITEIYYGDEEWAFEWTSKDNTYQIYKMEITGSSTPLYMCKEMHLTENSELERKYLEVNFFYFDMKSAFFRQQEGLSIPKVDAGVPGACLIQMWFKEMEGKVYIFRIYNLSDYNYMMSIVLADGSTVRPLKRYFLLPRKNILEAIPLE